MPDDYNYGIAVTVSNLASAEIAKINKQLEGLGKQVQRNVKTTEKGAKDEQKAVRAYGAQIKEQLTTKKYLNNLLKQDQQTFKRTNALISEQGALSKINTDIQKKGYNAISKAEKQALNNSVKAIKVRQKGGMQLAGWARTNEEAILKVDENFRKHGTNLRKTVTGINAAFSGMGKVIHKVGMTFLTIIGPLFLVGAAVRMMQSAIDAIMQPFLGFEDGLYELRKTADLTKEEMLAMGDAIEEMAQRIPLARKELVEIAATAGRLGIQGRENILNFTEVVAMMATATVLSADEAANALARVSNAFQLPIANVEYLGSIINELSNTTASNSREIVKSIENVGASGKMIGISIDAVAAMSSTLIAAGMSSERSGTRLRRFFTEMARNSSKMADAMDIDAATMKISIEEDPTKAIMDYLDHLRKIPSRIDKVVEAQEIFGKVGGFAVATLAENYVELEQNMSSARTELAFGTSLQREFEIATSKTSAQLQMLDNRIEAATANIGEDFVPTIKKGKSILAGMAEALADVSAGFWSIGEGAKDATTQIDAMVEEMSRLREEAEEGYNIYDKIGKILAISYSVKEKLYDPRKIIEYDKEIKELFLEVLGLKKKEVDLNEVFRLQDKLIDSANVAYGTQAKKIKEVTDFEGKHGVALKKIEDLNIQIRDSERGMAAAEKAGRDVYEDRIRLLVDEEIIRIQGMQTTRDALKEKIKSGAATKKEKEAYAEISQYLKGYVDENDKITKVLSKKNASERLSTKVTNMKSSGMGKEHALYIQLYAAVGDYADEIINAADHQEALNKHGYEAVMIEDQLHIVRVEAAKDLYALEDPTLRIAAAVKKFGNVTSESMEDFIDRMIKAREESSLLYYDIINQASAWNELGNIMVTDNETMRESISNFTDLEKSGRRLVVTHKGLEVITTAEAAKMKKLGKQIIYVTDAMEEMNELGQDSITIWGELTIAQSDYEDRLNSVWGLTSSYINTLRKLGDAQLLFAEATDTMPVRIQELWRPYEKTFDEIQSLVAAGEDYEAGILIQNIALDMHQKKMSATSKQERKDLDKMMGYMDDYVQSVGLVPLEYKEIQDEVQLLEDLMKGISEGEIVITPDLNDTPFSDAMKRLLDADYVTSVQIEANLVEVKKQIEEVAAVALWKPVSVEKAEAAEKRAAIQKTQEPYGKEPGPWLEDYSFMEKVSKGEPLPPYEYEDQTKTYGEAFVEGVGNGVNTIVEVIMTGTNAIADEFNKEVAWIEEKWEAAKEEGGKIIKDPIGYVGGIFGLAKGGPIPKTGLYQLHEGEHVLNKRETSHVKNVHAALGISDIAPSMQTGGHIKKTGVYNLHEGEDVLTKEEAKNPQVSSDEVLSKMWSEINDATPHHKTEADVVDTMKEGGGVDKDGLYQLHEGEAILSKPDVDAIEKSQKTIKEGTTMNYDTKNERSNIYNNPISKAVSNIKNDYNNPNNNVEGERTINIHIGTIALDENYDVKKFINDMETMAMSG